MPTDPEADEDDAVAEEQGEGGEVEPTEAAEPEPLDPQLVLRADKVGITPDELRDLGDKAEKAVSIHERKMKPAEQVAPPDDDDLPDAEFDPRLVKHVKSAKAEMAILREEAQMRRVRDWVEDQMGDSDTIPADMVTPKNRNAVFKALKELAEKPGNEKKAPEVLYKEAEKIALGDRLKGRASAALKPTATQRPNQAAPKQSAWDRTMAAVLAKSNN